MSAEATNPRKRRRLKRAAVALLIIAGLALGAATTLSYYLAGERQSYAAIGRTSHAHAKAPTPAARPTLRVMTLNLAHGRKDGTHQLLQSTARIRANLDDVVTVLKRLEPDVVALQEADGPSFWSGGFSHVELVAERASFGYFSRAEHVKGLGLSYGTAVVSKRHLRDASFVTFEPTPPSPSKGFLIATVVWPVDVGKTTSVDVISVHLDFSRRSVRESQIAAIVKNVKPRERPLIVMGDFNCSWTDEESPLKALARELDLKVFQPDASTLATFPARGTRLDWILISSDLEFRNHQVVPDTLSDHLAVMAEVGVAE